MSRPPSDAHSVHSRSVTPELDVHFPAGTPSVPANRSPQRFPRATTRLRTKKSRRREQPSHGFKPAHRAKVATLHCDWRFNRWMWFVSDEFEIFEFELVNVFNGRIQL